MPAGRYTARQAPYLLQACLALLPRRTQVPRRAATRAVAKASLMGDEEVVADGQVSLIGGRHGRAGIA